MKILLVEDDPQRNELLCSMLVAENFTITPAFDGHEAINYIKTRTFDLIVSDVDLGSSPDGFQVYRAFKDSGGGAFILYTSADYPELAKLAERLGILNFISNAKWNLMDIKKAAIEMLSASVKRNTEITDKLLGL